MARCHHPLSGPLAARPPHPSPANRDGGRIPAPVPPCTTANRPFAPRTAPIPLATPASRQPTARERSSWQVCCTCSRAPRAARREAQSATPTAAQVRFLPSDRTSEAGPAHTSSTLSHARPSSHLTATILLTPPLPSLASLAGSRRHRGRPVLRPLFSRMWAVLGAVRPQREPHAQNSALHLLVVSVLGRVAACMFVFRLAVALCPCRAMSVRVRGACPCRAVVNLRLCM